MKFQDSVFNQLLKVIPGYWLDRLIAKHKGDYRVRKLGCRELLLALLYGQYTGRRSLRDLALNFNVNRHHFYHLGCRGEVKRSTLSDANNNRPVALFQELFDGLVTKALPGKKKQEAQRMVSLLDASTVILNQTRFAWATGHGAQGGIKIHTVYDLDAEIPTYFEITPARNSDLSTAKTLTFESDRYYVFDRGYYDFQYWHDLDQAGCWFVTRLKKNSPTQVKRKRAIPRNETSILGDHEVMLNQRMARSRSNPYDRCLREITVKLEEKDEPIRIVTNDMKSKASEIADLYKKRWQIELFFKWIKQHLKIKTFLGTSENAVRIQVLVAMIAFIVLKLLNEQLPFRDTPILVLSRLIETNLMRRTSLVELLKPPPNKPPPINRNTLQGGFSFA